MSFGKTLVEVILSPSTGVELAELGVQAGAGTVRRPGEVEAGHRHVARDAGGRLEVLVQALQRARTRAHGSRFRFNMAAMRPAPKPLSMLTTATPAAHEFNIDSSAAIPPRLAP